MINLSMKINTFAMKRIKDLPRDDQPREKLVAKGADSLTDAELIAILLRTGIKGKNVVEVARDLIKEFGDFTTLGKKSIQELTKILGIGRDKAVTLSAAFEIGKRTAIQISEMNMAKKITSAEDVANIFIPRLRDEVKENFFVVCLSTSNTIIRAEKISVGTLDASLVHPREVFKIAILNNSKSIILVHNHPSGNPEPSDEDYSITKKFVEAGKILNIPILDHVVIAGGKFTSIMERRQF